MKILLFAFRSGQKRFFKQLKKESPNAYTIISSKELWLLSANAWKNRNRVDLSRAVSFGVDEFIARIDIVIPRFLLTLYFSTMAKINYYRYHRAFEKSSYDGMLIWNGGKCRQLIAIEIAKLFNVKVIFFENGLLPNRQVLDGQGINFENSVPRDRNFFESYHNTLELPKTLIPRNPKNKKKFEMSNNRLPKTFIFVPFQVDFDTQILTNSKWIKSMRELFTLIESLAKEFDYQFVLKEHPSSSKNYPDLHKKANEISNIHFANGYATQELIEQSLAVITINSTVGIESLLFKKRVIVLGDAFYGIEGITKRVKNEDSLREVFKNLDKWKFNEKLVENFLKYLYYDYLIVKDETIYKSFNTFIVKEIV